MPFGSDQSKVLNSRQGLQVSGSTPVLFYVLALTGVVLAGAVEAAPIPAVLATKSSSCSELPSASVLALSSAGLPRLPFCVHAALADDGRPRPRGGGGFWKKLVMSFSPAACAAASDLCGIGTGGIPSAQR